jgi:histidyl-tRNA synthetase
MADALWKELGIKDVVLQLNSLGQPEERNLHRAALIQHFESNASVLDAEANRRLHLNPLRLLDSKNPQMQSVIESAPKLLDFLGEKSKTHLTSVMAILDANDVPYVLNPRLVRGMDYYNLTVFEFVTTQLGSQGTICAGGRYDYLIEQIGGKPAPAVGWAMGVERVLELLKEQDGALQIAPLDAYAVVSEVSDLPRVSAYLQTLRAFGVSIQMHASADGAMASIKSQFKKADASGARYVLVFGVDELAQGCVTIKSLRDASQAQQLEPLSQLSQWAEHLQSKA